jgi:KUP system potassium uptake protein
MDSLSVKGGVPSEPKRVPRAASVAPTGPHGSLASLSLLATGVVFGDIGTSPLYAIKECVDPDHGVAITQANVFGILSLVFWSLTMVVTVKYLTFIMKADNRGEGGILALLAAPRTSAPSRGWSSSVRRCSTETA